MTPFGIRRIVAIASVVGSLLLGPIVVLAQTGTPPPEPSATTEGVGWWRVLLAMGGVAIVVLAIRVPRARRWVAAAVILAGGACVALFIALLGTMAGWSGQPAAPWTVPGAIGALLVSLALAVVVVRRGRSLRGQRPARPVPRPNEPPRSDGAR